MRTKLSILLTILLAISLLSVACKDKGGSEVNGMEDSEIKYMNGVVVNNTTPLSKLLTREYDLQELKDFFGEYSPNEKMVLESLDDGIYPTIYEVDQRFTIECLRCVNNGSFYSVYKVSEGGYFYVFWIESFPSLKGTPVFGQGELNVYFTTHLSKLSKARGFIFIKKDKSTAEDVSHIDPSFELMFGLSSGVYSYSLLDNGKVMQIEYYHPSEMKTRSDLIVKKKTILPKEESHSILSLVFPGDLP